MEQELILSPQSVAQILLLGMNAGRQFMHEQMGKDSKYISQNKACKIYGKGRVQGWVEAGLLKRIHSGGGEGSTILYERAALMALDASNKIVFRKRRYSENK